MKRTFKFLTAITLTLLLVFGGTLSAFALNFTPGQHVGYKVDDVENLAKNVWLDFSVGNNDSSAPFSVSIRITIDQHGNEVLEWKTPSPYWVSQVQVKGSNEYRNYFYNPSATAGSNLYGPEHHNHDNKTHNISHIIFIPGEPDNPFVPSPGLSLVKEASESFAYPGDTINFTITITNTGNVPLTNVSLVDPLIPSVNETFDLALGGVKVVNASYVIPEDFDGVSVTNIATASAVYEQEALSATDDAVVPVYPVPVDPVYDISLTKLSNVTSTVQGGVIQFTLTVENTGTATLFDVVLNDPLLGLVVEIGTLEKGDIWSNTYPYNVPANATGNVVNEADVIGYYYLQDESTESVTDDAIVTVPIIIPVDPDPEDPDPVDPDPSDPDPILGTVIVSYVDTEGNTLSPSFSFTGEVGTNYGTSARIIDGFSLVETPSNASGSFINGTINVIYVYDNGSSEPEILELDLDETPLGPATPDPVDSSLPPEEPLEEPIDEIILLQEEVPLGDGLPQTGQLPSLLFYGLGSVISLMGVSLKKYKR